MTSDDLKNLIKQPAVKLIIAFTLLITSLMAVYYFRNYLPKASVLPMPSASLSYRSETNQYQVGDIISVTVVTTTTDQVTAADFCIKYDSKVLKILSIEPTNILPQILRPVDISNPGRACIAVGIEPGQLRTGDSTIALIKFEAISQTDTTVIGDYQTPQIALVGNAEAGINGYSQTTPLTLKINSGIVKDEAFLSLTSPTQTISPGDVIDITATVKGSNIAAIETYISFDDDLFTVEGQINLGSALPVVLKQPLINSSTGTISFTLGAETEGFYSGSGILATFQLRAKDNITDSSSTFITYLSKTRASGKDSDNNIIQALNPLTVNISVESSYYCRCDITGENGEKDNKTNIYDFSGFCSQFGKTGDNIDSDFNNDKVVNIWDYSDFLKDWGCGWKWYPTGAILPTSILPPTNTPAINPTNTIYPTIKPTQTNSPTQIIPSLSEGGHLWIDPDRLMKLPTTGKAWDNVKADAYSNWGDPCLDENNCTYDTDILAGALVGKRLNDSTLITKTINAMNRAIRKDAETSRALELGRGLFPIIIAADLLGYQDPEFKENLKYLVWKDIPGHTCRGIPGTAECDGSNWSGVCRAAGFAAGVYLNDQALLKIMTDSYYDYIGVKRAKIQYTDTTWHADFQNKAGVNRKEATIQGKNVSGVLTEDARRASGFKWPPGKTGYMWEGMQHFIDGAVVAHNAGLIPITAGENAVLRAMNWLYGQGEAARNDPVFKYPAEGDDKFVPWLVNYYLGTNFPTESPISVGKSAGYTDWTHQKGY